MIRVPTAYHAALRSYPRPFALQRRTPGSLAPAAAEGARACHGSAAFAVTIASFGAWLQRRRVERRARSMRCSGSDTAADTSEDTSLHFEDDVGLGMELMMESIGDRFEDLPDALGIEKRASSILEAGDGVWATRDFYEGEMVLVYGGSVISEDEFLGAAGLTGYVIQTETGYYVDGRLDKDWLSANPLALGQYCNHPTGGRMANLMTVTLPPASEFAALDDELDRWLPKEAASRNAPLILGLALRDIEAGEELFFDYKLNPETAPYWYESYSG